jgi:dTDP-4-amino-4,6-dideoxygalactose transaminase
MTLASSDTVPFLDLPAQHAEIRAEVDDAWARVTAESAFVGGSYLERFESEFAEYCGVRHCIGVANGTDALILILASLGVAGHEVIVPGNTFVATAEAVVAAGAIPVFVDVDPDTLLVTAEHVATAISPRTAAVIVVHLYGQMPNMDAICRVADRAGIAVVEDAAQAHGASWMHHRAGSYGHAAAFSFYPGKNLGAFGDAGAVTTNDPVLAQHIRTLANHGRTPSGWHAHDIVGCNSRLDGLQAAILSVKLRRLDQWNAGRMAAAAHYQRLLADSHMRPLQTDALATAVYHLQVVRAPDRKAVLGELDAYGIGWGLHYPVPCHQQPAFVPFAADALPVTEQAAAEIISLPMFPTITGAQIERVCEALLAVPEETPYGKAG